MVFATFEKRMSQERAMARLCLTVMVAARDD